MTSQTTHDFGDGKGPVPAHQHHNGGGWVADSAWVTDDAWIADTAKVYGSAWVNDRARLGGYARVYGMARVHGSARVYDRAQVYGSAQVSGDAQVYGCARVYGRAWVTGRAWITEPTSRTPKVLLGFTHALTITDDMVRAGCECHPLSVWRKRGAAIIRADGHSTADARVQAALIVALAEAHGCAEEMQP